MSSKTCSSRLVPVIVWGNMDKREGHAGTHQLYDTPMLQYKTPAASYERNEKRRNKEYLQRLWFEEALADELSSDFSCVVVE